MIIEFDFKPVLRNIMAAHDDFPPQDIVQALPFLLPTETIRDFAAAYFSKDFSDDINYFLLENPSPVPGFLTRPYLHYAPEDHAHFERTFEDYFMTEKETETAWQFYSQVPNLGQSMAALQGMLYSYFESMKDALEKESPEVKARLQGVTQDGLNLSSVFSFLHDLMPAMAYSMTKDGVKPGDEITAQSYQRGLASSFRHHAWASSVDDRMVYCPFPRHIGHLFATVLEKGPDGALHAMQDQERPGALMVFISKLIIERNIEPLPNIYPPEVGF